MRSHKLASRYVVNDVRRNTPVTVALLLLLTLSSALVAGSVLVIERVNSSVTHLFDTAQPPHFLQLHTGEVSRAALQDFASARDDIEAWQLAQMVGFAGTDLQVQRGSGTTPTDLSGSLIDHLFVTQNPDFDYLLDDDGAIPEPAVGEVYVPIALADQFDIGAGDILAVNTGAQVEALTVAGTVRDAQMGSSMASAARFVVAPQDVASLMTAPRGTPETLVAYRLTDTADVAAFQQAYERDPRLPTNGQAVTEVMIRLVTVISEGLVAAVGILAGCVLIGIALLNMRFVIRSSLQDELHEIGTLRALGIPPGAITRLYLTRYLALTVVASVSGLLLALAGGALVAGDSQQAPITAVTVLLPVAAVVLVNGLVLGICALTLRRSLSVNVLDALLHGTSALRAQRLGGSTSRSVLGSTRGPGVNRRLAQRLLRWDLRHWMIVPIVFGLATVMVTIPAQLLSTFESPSFMQYLGAPQTDLRIEIHDQNSSVASQDHESLMTRLAEDPRATNVQSYAHQRFDVAHEGSWQTLNAQLGDHSGAAIAFVDGQAPGSSEIALSTLNAQALEVTVGDDLRLQDATDIRTLQVSGVYQDVTAGGYTAKIHDPTVESAARWTVFSDVRPGVDPGRLAAEYRQDFATAQVLPMTDYVDQTLAYVTDGLRSASWIIFIIALGAVTLITTLFLRLQLSRNHAESNTLRLLGFSARQLTLQTMAQLGLMILVGIGSGLVLAATAGQWLTSQALAAANFGIIELSFISNPVLIYLIYPGLLIGTSLLGAILLLRKHYANRAVFASRVA
ncbi:ABC transporter permease [Enteractinococcus helveticum]|uniref:ABC3 transporter permease C-terminal domain-containing protein n=1 Tax=Enteractinococcus helveticum TaxID=1837282 RepID=A0A1B7LXK2_9MICC|nr:ABC transporter permease [Enteractinococcus helveticum]OAV59894.1 hypothetical protein A6F49_14160 [Enteractinococcus helveticum]